MGIKIEGWSAKNFRNLTLVDVEVEDYVLRVSGKNGAGKSSVIEAIFMAILGPKYAGKNPQRMIQKGKEKATITVSLRDGDKDLEITRTISSVGMKLKAKASDGSKVSQEYLDGLINLTMIDPLSWAESKPAVQIADLKEKAGIDTSVLEDKYDEIFKERTYQNREVKRLNGVVDSFADVKIEGPGITLADAHQAKSLAAERNSKAEADIRMHESSKQKIVDLDTRETQLKEEIYRINETLLSIENEKKVLVDAVDKFKPAHVEDLGGYDDDIAVAESISEKLGMIKEREKAESDLTEAVEIAEESTDELNTIKADIEKAILDADLPFDNIEFDNDLGVIVDGIPMSEHSTAEQIKAAIRINSKFSPHLRVVYIKDGSLLDKDTLVELEDLSVSEEFLFLIELVEEQEDSIVMRSGNIVEE